MLLDRTFVAISHTFLTPMGCVGQPTAWRGAGLPTLTRGCARRSLNHTSTLPTGGEGGCDGGGGGGWRGGRRRPAPAAGKGGEGHQPEQPLERPRQVDRRRPGGAETVGSAGQVGAKGGAVSGVRGGHRGSGDGQPERRRRANGGHPADDYGADGVGD